MGYKYYDYYTTPIISYVNSSVIITVATLAAIVLGIVLFCTFLKPENEGKYTGFKGKLYNMLVFNRFYAENIIKLLYIIAACVVTVIGIILIVLGSFMSGFIMIAVINIVLRIFVELLLMFIILCKKTATMDRRLSKIEKFYSEEFDDEWDCHYSKVREDDIQTDCQFDSQECSQYDGYSDCRQAAEAEADGKKDFAEICEEDNCKEKQKEERD